MQPSKRHPSRSDLEEDEYAAKKVRANPLLLLPPEVWELIFRNLNVCWLRSARLTCSTWNRIICGSSRLMDRFVLFLTKNDFCGEDRKHVRKLLADGGRYTRAKFLFVGIGQNKPRVGWFAHLGVTLHTLSLDLNCTHVFLAQLLKETPNLKQIIIRVESNASFRNVVPDFQLEKLEGLRLERFPCQNLVSFFSHICPRLRVLKVEHWIGHELAPEMIVFIRKVRETLEELKYIGASKSFLEEMIAMDDLRLKRITIDSSEQSIAKFLKKQPEVEHLELSWWTLDPNSAALFASLSNLKTLQIKIDGRDHQNLPKLAHIEKLSLEFVGYRDLNFDFRIFHLFKLRSLQLKNCFLTFGDFFDLEQTHITTLILEDCYVCHFPNFSVLDSLNHLELKLVSISKRDDRLEHSSSLVSLKLSYIKTEYLPDLVEQFSNVKQLEIGNGVIDEANLHVLRENFLQLEELRLSGICTPADIQPLVNDLANFSALEKLVVRCYSLAVKASIAEVLRGVRQDVAVELLVDLFD